MIIELIFLSWTVLRAPPEPDFYCYRSSPGVQEQFGPMERHEAEAQCKGYPIGVVTTCTYEEHINCGMWKWEPDPVGYLLAPVESEIGPPMTDLQPALVGGACWHDGDTVEWIKPELYRELGVGGKYEMVNGKVIVSKEIAP